METKFELKNIRAIIGLGNPGQKYYKNRHNIGFRVIDSIAQHFNTSWQRSELMEYATVRPEGYDADIYLIKPLTFMNASGQVIPWLLKKGIKAEQILVVHDELEKGYGQLLVRFGGSHKGHNGLKSIMGMIGQDFWRLKFGIGRPDDREQVPAYVLQDFTRDQELMIPGYIDQVFSLLGM